MNQIKRPTRRSFPETTMESAPKVYEREPSHILEERWALYVDTEQLLKMIDKFKKLPVVSVAYSIASWIPEGLPEHSGKVLRVKPNAYFFRFTAQITVGMFEFTNWRCLSENTDMDYYKEGVCFRHEAPAPVVPWPDCRVTIETPRELYSAVDAGMKQAEEALIIYLGQHNPAITAMII